MGASRKQKQQSQQKGKPKSRPCSTKFFGDNAKERRAIKKLARILKSSGPEAAKAWAEKHGHAWLLNGLASPEGFHVNHNFVGGRGTKIGELAQRAT
jgi:hypothetical protein